MFDIACRRYFDEEKNFKVDKTLVLKNKCLLKRLLLEHEKLLFTDALFHLVNH